MAVRYLSGGAGILSLADEVSEDEWPRVHFRRVGPRNNRRSDNLRRTQMQMPIPTWKLVNLPPEELGNATVIDYLWRIMRVFGSVLVQ